VLLIPISRKWLSFFMSNLLPSVIIVLGGLSALFLDPTAPPLVGGRTALTIIAMLTSVSIARSAPRYPYFMWMDALTLFSLALLLIGLAETMYVHQLIRGGRKAEGLAIDSTFRFVLPAVYLFSIVSIVVYAFLSGAHDIGSDAIWAK